MILAEFHFDFLTPTGISEIRELCQHAYAAGWMQRGPVVTDGLRLAKTRVGGR